MVVIELAIPRPPSVNHAFANAPGRGRVKSAAYRAWRESCGWTIKAQKPGRIAGPFAVEIVCPRPDNRRRDIDNIIKPTLDALCAAGVTDDDHRCEAVSARWAPLDPSADMTVRITAEAGA